MIRMGATGFAPLSLHEKAAIKKAPVPVGNGGFCNPGRRRLFALQTGVALRPIAATLLNPLQVAITAIGLVGIVLSHAGLHACLTSREAGILGRYSTRKHDVARRDRCTLGRNRSLRTGHG